MDQSLSPPNFFFDPSYFTRKHQLRYPNHFQCSYFGNKTFDDEHLLFYFSMTLFCFIDVFRGGQLRHVGESLQLQTDQVSLRVRASVQRGVEGGHAALLQIHGKRKQS